MRLVIEVDAEYVNDETDIETFVTESRRDGASLILQVGSPISEEESHITRHFQLHADQFAVRSFEPEVAIPSFHGEETCRIK